jgi:YHS domain-containing protein
MKGAAKLVSMTALVCLWGFLFLQGGGVYAEADNAQKKCPVMGGDINRDLYTDYQGKRIYFCCAYCIGEFEKDPAEYVRRCEEQGVELEDAVEPQDGEITR